MSVWLPRIGMAVLLAAIFGMFWLAWVLDGQPPLREMVEDWADLALDID